MWYYNTLCARVVDHLLCMSRAIITDFCYIVLQKKAHRLYILQSRESLYIALAADTIGPPSAAVGKFN